MKILYYFLGAILALVQTSLCGAMSNDDYSTTPPNQMNNAKYFQIFDINAGAGYGGVTLVTSRKGIKPQAETNYGGDGAAVQLKLGGNYAFCKLWLVGLEAYGQYNSAETKNRFFETATSTTATSRTFKMEWNLGLDLRFGISPCPSNLIFIYGGPDWGQYNFKYVTTGVNSTHKKFKIGGVLGAGLEQIIREHWTIRATFDYRWYGSETLSYSNGEKQTIKARLATALFMFGYVF